jgi:hypothetical protein
VLVLRGAGADSAVVDTPLVPRFQNEGHREVLLTSVAAAGASVLEFVRLKNDHVLARLTLCLDAFEATTGSFDAWVDAGVPALEHGTNGLDERRALVGPDAMERLLLGRDAVLVK